ncbi:M20/M25/M40 family metallo-hydrolase [bacterium]|nr:M20/M25/M40 family metallo-hydrolase [bacterium]
MKYVLYILLGLFLLLLIIILIRTFLFIDKEIYKTDYKEKEIDDKIVEDLKLFIKCKTVSYIEKEKEDKEEFEKLIEDVKTRYPLIFSKCETRILKNRGIYIKVKGSESNESVVLLAHYDVVEATHGWDNDPFLGEIVDGKVYGRGALDTKCTFASALRALEENLKFDYKPKRDLYLCFGADEEIYGTSQYEILEILKNDGVRPMLVFDEGGGVIKNAFPGVKDYTALLGTAEKGMFDVKLSLDTSGGHSSSPKKNGPIIELSRALERLDKHPMKPQFCMTTKELLNKLGRHSSFIYKMIFANLWLFKGLLKRVFMLLGGDTKALVSSTFAFTVINGGNQTNVIPSHVEANINVRQAPFNSKEEIISHIKKTIKNDRIKIEVLNESKMYKECEINTEGYNLIKETIKDVYPGSIVSPFIMIGGTDARHYNEISDCIIRFTPIKIENIERKGIHGTNEAIKIETLKKCLEFYLDLLSKV